MWSPCASSQASATCAGVASRRSATRLHRSTSAWLASIASGWKRGLFLRKSPGGNFCGCERAGQEAAAERREGQERGAVRGAPRDDLGERVARPQRRLGLHATRRGGSRARARARSTLTSDSPSAPTLPCGDQLGHRAPGLLERHLGVDAVQLVEVDEVGPQALQRALDRLAHVLRAAVLGASRTRRRPRPRGRTWWRARPRRGGPRSPGRRAPRSCTARTCRRCRAASRRCRARGGWSRSTPPSSRSAGAVGPRHAHAAEPDAARSRDSCRHQHRRGLGDDDRVLGVRGRRAVVGADRPAVVVDVHVAARRRR